MVKDGKSIAMLQQAEITEGNLKWKNSVIFYVIGYYPTIAVVHRYIAENWNVVAKPDVFWHDNRYFLIKFQNFDDMNVVLNASPHMFFGKAAIVKPWSKKFDFHAEILRTVPIWVKLPNLPLNCWGVDTLSRLGSVLGVPLCADECTSKHLRVSFARLLIEVDVTKTLPKNIYVPESGGNGSMHNAGVFTPAPTTVQATSDDDWRVVGRKQRSHSNPPVFTNIPHSNTYAALLKDGNGARELVPIGGDGNPPLGL
ncbi:uncharacterized protein LOC110732124 [Chenopodium quinoa]|uniref:uncharacterized protein LOC110732124 n=1 Tax=Chenopodium quinoa TaxID=63459 RepID=UPI000B7960BA|nr:uncharacterized protein LOC110732124 [Chenopodium quinoa]